MVGVGSGGRQENSLGTVRQISQVLYTNTRESCDTLKGRHKYESRVAEGPCVHEGRLEIQRWVADESLSLTADCAAVGHVSSSTFYGLPCTDQRTRRA